ncbi:class I SAM-dependent methyltransferase [Actinomadura sp. DC4]|uniref:class I SAM-dependent methyltransferase n=1 Tax=Actinomadura sp. DC4 TaxID=3055069 RepID=UPI0025B12B55|nr:class I SAM-dependent methyltransferase [Actinomadura sp. DC4]MDN3352132.1 methyltransferase domain-containing protein [Actinomadura sp. DC4]
MAHHHPPADFAAMAEVLDLDAEVFHSFLTDVITWAGERASAPPRRILDLGSGTGAGALALARRFPEARVTALDVSGPLLERLRGKARDLGVADRVSLVEADVDTAWPALDPVDLVWASASLHHLADPDRVLADVLATLRPGGLLVAAEIDSFPRFLPEGFGDGLEERCQALLDERRAAELPHIGSDWGTRLTRAGYANVVERIFAVELTAPLPASAGRYAQASLRRMRSGVEGRLSADDLALLDSLIDGPQGVLHRDDLALRTTRPVWLAGA